jgi:hypothetical protein
MQTKWLILTAFITTLVGVTMVLLGLIAVTNRDLHAAIGFGVFLIFFFKFASLTRTFYLEWKWK